MSDLIRVRACLAVVRDNKILLVPAYDTDVGPIQWSIPGGRVEFGEPVREAAVREFLEETGFRAEITGILDVSEVVLPERPYHSIAITFAGRIVGGALAAEPDHPYGEKIPQWFSARDLEGLAYHPKATIEKALNV